MIMSTHTGTTLATNGFVSLIVASLLLLTGCQRNISITSHSNDAPHITPDYAGTTIPCNIAPLCFSVEGMADAALIVKGGTDSICVTTDDGNLNIPEDEWHSLLGKHRGGTLTFTVCRKKDGGWEAMRPFSITVSADSIDAYVVYRRIQPGYGLWDKMGIYQRNLETYDEEAIYENKEGNGNCVNCHSFNQGNPDQWQVHIRRNHGGTYIINGREVQRLSLNTESNAPKPVYPSWHPGGRYIAYSTNKTFFHIHTRDKNRWEVMDDGSDVMVADTETGDVIRSPFLSAANRYETFPCFSPDGKWLYYSTAAAVDTLVRQYDKVRYAICRIPFDAATASLGNSADTVCISPAESFYMARISPDGKWLCTVRSPYGNFGVCHRDARLHLVSLTDGSSPTDGAAPCLGSWHSWSSNSRWMVFSSKRDDGTYTRLYFMHVSPDGKCSKPFVLPQRNAKDYYDLMMDGYNIPELVRGKVKASPVEGF